MYLNYFRINFGKEEKKPEKKFLGKEGRFGLGIALVKEVI